ncbi:dihydrofolate reductase family protein [Streptomyces coeruleoprunus]|uniref:Dihydrofolate reductase family protein n=1 Tax=Streptomyces coeruleoprunus TaxID=285563 RepID=A0ABV9XFW5_9ACTN
MGRKIVSGLLVSLDGVVDAPERWRFPYGDEETGAAPGLVDGEAEAVLPGRVTYEAFDAVWPYPNGLSGYVRRRFQRRPPTVAGASDTLGQAVRSGAAVVDGDVAAALRALKRGPGRNIDLSGSVTLTRSLLEAGLVDELRLLVHPIVVGSGQRLFPDGTGRVPLRLTRSATLSTGVVDLTYAC